MLKKTEMWTEISKLSNKHEVEIQVTFKGGKKTRFVIYDGENIHSFVEGWDNLMLKKIQTICNKIDKKRAKEITDINKRLEDLKKNPLPEFLFDKNWKQ